MYEELIERLKEDAEWAKANEWESPITLGDNIREAINAMEDLTERYKEAAADVVKAKPFKCPICGGRGIVPG